jgi:8-oxo-dGTP diphosphatase
LKSKLRKTHWIPVAAGFLRRGSQILVGQRPENHSLAGQWEFPGGKIESGESPEAALARELSEELGVEAEIGELKFSCTHSYGDVNILILFFEVLYWKGDPKPKHHLMLEWIEPQDLGTRNIPEANRKMLDRIYKALGVEWPK